MADIRFQVLNVAGINVGEINGYTVDSKTGGEVAIGAGYILGISEGVVQAVIKVTAVIPTIGHSLDLYALHLSQAEFSVGYPHNGKIYVWPAKCTEHSGKSDAKTGMVTGDITITQAGPAVSL